MKIIEIKLPELGKSAGTCAWVSEKLVKINDSFKMESTKKGLPCLTYEHPIDKDITGEPKRYIFCVPNSQYFEGMREYNSSFCVYSENDDYKNGIFNYLTPAAQKLVQDFIENIVDEFISKLNEA